MRHAEPLKTRPTPETLLSPAEAAAQLLEAAALVGYGSGGRTGLVPVMREGRPAYFQQDVHTVAGLIRLKLETAA